MLLFGISTAYICAVMQAYWVLMIRVSLNEDFVFLRVDGMTAGRLAQKRLTRSSDALGYSKTDYVR